MKKVITFGTFDLLHDGHLRILERAKALGDYLVVGVSTDRLNAEKGKRSFFDQRHRLECVAALKAVDEVFYEDSLAEKDHYIREHQADVLVMGDDWEGKFDWVSCEVVYLPRTPGVSSTEVKVGIEDRLKCKRVLFGDTYIGKHYDCALSLVNELTAANVAPIFTTASELPEGLDCDCLVYFNLPVSPPRGAYADKPRVLVDHGASNLKWFLANQDRFNFFDVIVTAGPDHSRSLLTFFPDGDGHADKVRSAGFIKAKQLLSAPTATREEIASRYRLDPAKPIILFAPTWHISNNLDMAKAIDEIAGLDNHVTLLHPETAHLDVSRMNVAANVSGTMSELLKHADCLISDLSSTIFEAAALGKPVVQVLLREYSDNNATLYDFPYAAGSADLFCGGYPTRPGGIRAAVEAVMSDDPHVADALLRMRRRILAGTAIGEDSADSIVSEIVRACELDDVATKRALRGVSPAVHADSLAMANLFFSRNATIAHKGGDCLGYHASNSAEAVERAIRVLDVVELDLLRCGDGVIVAREGNEAHYGFDRPFAEVSVQEFLAARYDERLRPIALGDAIRTCARRDKALVCSIGSDADYEYIAQQVYTEAERQGLVDRVVLQCYDRGDFHTALRLGFRRAMLAVWKHHYRDPLGPDALAFVEDCMRTAGHAVVGIAVPYQNKHMPVACVDDPRAVGLYSFWKRVYVHGAPMSAYGRVLNANFGLFADGYSQTLDFDRCPDGFHWRSYLFLNPDVALAGHANQIGATTHYLQYGQQEGRLHRYSAPNDFSHAVYVDMNPVLRTTGVSGADTAKAHWTKFGAKEQRRYKR
ncbi:adenylyltransferase/cytidyltransferase family protein [Lysobacter sp. Root983]|uniref:adenylyltransferase/cytidyltransferase family protein n=1 Tax=Lysobacter sp. Root983 TaxID=1736613 RepID=UPI0009EB5E4A|nr:adenylyltransferase/cytidyltransferase family protein [Lysobacter sp. Root983]